MKKPEEAMTKEEFFEWAAMQDQPYELIDGRPRPKWLCDDSVTMMAGESSEHIDIQVSLTEALNAKIREKGLPCRAAPYGLNVTLAAGPNSQGKDHVVYPDAVIDCAYRDRPKGSKTAASPKIVCEILSPSNRGHDEGSKLRWYKETLGVENIVYLEQDKIDVRLFVRLSDGKWLEHLPLRSLTDVLHLPALDVSLTLAEFYGIVFGA